MSDDKFTFMKDIWQNIPKPSELGKKMTNSDDSETNDVTGFKEQNDPVNPEDKVVILGHGYVGNEIRMKVKELIWLSYRTGFEPITKNPEGPHPLQFISSMVFNKNPFSAQMLSFVNNDLFTTDVGWGCMIRTSQSLLANSLMKLNITSSLDEVIKLFQDNNSSKFSLHNFIKVAGESPLQVRPGQWFGPNAASLSIQRLCKSFDNFNVLISETSDIYYDQVNPINNNLLILLPIRLGIDKTNSIYHESIIQLLNLPQSIGIAGGRPSSSFYFFGFDEASNELLYLDPHYPQNSIQNDESNPDNIAGSIVTDSYHTMNYQRLKIDDLDPSMMVGLVIKDKEDYQDLKKKLVGSKIVHFHTTSVQQSMDYDVESLQEDENEDEQDQEEEVKSDKVQKEENKIEDQEFVLVDNNIENEEAVEVDNKIDSSYDVINNQGM